MMTQSVQMRAVYYDTDAKMAAAAAVVLTDFVLFCPFDAT